MVQPVGPIQPATEHRDPQKIHDAARQFEALLIAELLKTARAAAGSGWLTSGEDQASMPMLELAEQQFAQAIAGSGGLGLASMIVAGLQGPAPLADPDSKR